MKNTLLCCVLLALFPACELRSEAPAVALGPAPVVVELFTSQGCSSCPPADALLTKLAADPAMRGHVIPLAFHVDYWNHLGWRDPFSTAQWSDRQRHYYAALGSATVYTPQAIVNGRTEAVGSDETRIRRLIAEASESRAVARLSLSPLRLSGRTIAVDVSGEILETIRARDLRLVAVVFESVADTRVAAGENSGRTLHNDRIVRMLNEDEHIAAEGGTKIERTIELHTGPETNIQRAGVAVFLQDRQSRAIYAAAM
ncbi:MAG TPA: DUF1223 domain-containing protein [Thermoanaerobaculia bacterium]|nr:DUF1223 domain-containing protein [Thermoanaerobaculia bacterium]